MIFNAHQEQSKILFKIAHKFVYVNNILTDILRL